MEIMTAGAAEKALQASEKPHTQAGVTTPKQPLTATLQAIRTSPPLEAYRKAQDFQQMVNSPADGR